MWIVDEAAMQTDWSHRELDLLSNSNDFALCQCW